MMNVGLIGHGYWGKIMEPLISKYFNLVFIADSKKKYELDGLDWVFIASPTETHYYLVKKCLEQNINVFCEKPLTSDYNKSFKLIELAKKNNLKIYVDNIFLNRKEYLEFKKNLTNDFNEINFTWFKNGPHNDDLINSLFYHDLYLLLDIIDYDLFEMDVLNKKINKNDLDVSLILNNKIKVNFNYDRNKKIKDKNLKINNQLLSFNNPINNPLEDILKKISKNDYIDYEKNNTITLNTEGLIKKILK